MSEFRKWTLAKHPVGVPERDCFALKPCAQGDIQDAALFSLAQMGELEAGQLAKAVNAAQSPEQKAKRIRMLGLMDTTGPCIRTLSYTVKPTFASDRSVNLL